MRATLSPPVSFVSPPPPVCNVVAVSGVNRAIKRYRMQLVATLTARREQVRLPPSSARVSRLAPSQTNLRLARVPRVPHSLRLSEAAASLIQASHIQACAAILTSVPPASTCAAILTCSPAIRACAHPSLRRRPAQPNLRGQQPQPAAGILTSGPPS